MSTIICPVKIANQANSVGSLPSRQICDVPTELTATPDNEDHTQTNDSAIRKSQPEQESVHHPTRDNDIGTISVTSDLWSAAYREAINSLGDDIDVAILMASSTAQLFKELEEIDKDASQESAFLRGVAYLRSIQVPLERFKLVLDLASPLSKLDPTATTVFGVVRSVTAVSLFSQSIAPTRGKCIVVLTALNTDCHKLCNR